MFTLVTFVVLCLCLFELTAGLYLRRVKASRKRREAIDAIHYLKSSENFGPRGKFEHSPYGLYWNTKNYFVGSLRQTDSLGYRSHREAFEEKKPDEYLVLVLGSSTTYSDHFSLNPNASWPSRAEELLNQSELLEGRKIRVVMLG